MLSHVMELYEITPDEYNSLDNKGDKIKYPDGVSPAGTTFTIPSSITNYKLYHQWILMTEAEYANYKKLGEDIAKAQADRENLNDNATEEDKTTEDSEYNKKKTELETNILTLQTQQLDLIKKYDDTQWKETPDNKVYLPTAAEYILWAKLEESDGTTTFAAKIFSETEIITESNTVIDEEETIEEVTETTQTTTNPNTGINDYIMYIIPAALIAGTALVFKRNKSYN